MRTIFCFGLCLQVLPKSEIIKNKVVDQIKEEVIIQVSHHEAVKYNFLTFISHFIGMPIVLFGTLFSKLSVRFEIQGVHED